jgi:hypothetical protein
VTIILVVGLSFAFAIALTYVGVLIVEARVEKAILLREAYEILDINPAVLLMVVGDKPYPMAQLSGTAACEVIQKL